MRIGQEQSGYANHRGFRVWLAHVGIYERLTYSLEHRLPKNNLTIARWRILTVLHHAGNQTLIDLSIHTSIGPSTLSRLTEGMQRRRLVARNMFRLMYQRIVESRTLTPTTINRYM